MSRYINFITNVFATEGFDVQINSNVNTNEDSGTKTQVTKLKYVVSDVSDTKRFGSVFVVVSNKYPHVEVDILNTFLSIRDHEDLNKHKNSLTS